MRCKYTKQGANQYYDEHIDDYEEARDKAFNDEFRDFISEYITEAGLTIDGNLTPIITEDDIQGFLDSFTFKDEGEWLADGYESELGDCIDRAYDEYKERDI